MAHPVLQTNLLCCAESHPTLCDLTDCSPPQAPLSLEFPRQEDCPGGLPFHFSRRSSRSGWTWTPALCRQILYLPPWKAHKGIWQVVNPATSLPMHPLCSKCNKLKYGVLWLKKRRMNIKGQYQILQKRKFWESMIMQTEDINDTSKITFTSHSPKNSNEKQN